MSQVTVDDCEYQLGFGFVVSKDVFIRDGLIPSGAIGSILEINIDEYDGDGRWTPYKVFFDKCLTDDGMQLIDCYGVEIAGSDWFSESDLESMFSWKQEDYHSIISKTDGSVWGSGKNDSGQMATGDNVNSKVFTQISYWSETNIKES